MRTTVTLDEDVIRELRKIMRAQGKSLTEALNDAVHRGIHSGRVRAASTRRFRVRASPYSHSWSAWCSSTSRG
jgi:hypothetical protein